jgi:hypothetical protein
MNKLSLIAATLLTTLAATAVSAQTPSRADAIAVSPQARAPGALDASLSQGRDGRMATRAAKPAGKTRAEVLAELQRARESGELELLQYPGGPDPILLADWRLKNEALLASQQRQAQQASR